MLEHVECLYFPVEIVGYFLHFFFSSSSFLSPLNFFLLIALQCSVQMENEQREKK